MIKANKEFNMAREIAEQPDTIRRLFKIYVRGQQVEMPEFKEFTDKLSRARRFSFWGIGSSYHAALYANYLFEELCGLPCECESADELLSRHNILEPDTALVVLSQSGETSDLVEAVKRGKTRAALIIGIINNRESNLASLVDVCLHVRAGEEKALATTKVFSGQLFLLLLLALYRNQLKAKSPGRLIEAMKALPEKIETAIEQRELIARLAKKHHQTAKLLVLGRHWHYPIALETALKLKEAAYLPAEGMASETFRHGPKAIVDSGFLSFCYLPSDKNYADNLLVLQEIIKAKGQAIAVLNEETEYAGDQIIIPATEPALQPLVSLAAGQYLAYYLAFERGLDIDHPRNIFKYIKK